MFSFSRNAQVIFEEQHQFMKIISYQMISNSYIIENLVSNNVFKNPTNSLLNIPEYKNI